MKKQTKWTLIALALSCICLSLSVLIITEVIPISSKKPKYVFYFIGDGMSFNHILGTEQYNTVKEGKSEVERLNFSKFAVRNFVTNYSATHTVTDSAAAGTALATGCKTANTYIGVDAEGNAVRSIANVASELGYKVGLVTNVGINHATPSAFYGHTTDRFGFPALVYEYIASDIAFIAGSTIMDIKSSPKGSGPNAVTTEQLAEHIREAGIALELDVERAAKIENQRVAIVANPTKNSHIPYSIDRSEEDPHHIVNYTKAAIEYLSRESEDGFFLMVEGGKLDYAAHEQDPVATFYEVNEFAQTVDLALDFAKEHPEETLIIVTSDHETGGLSLGWNNYSIRMDMLMGQKSSALQVTKIIQQMRAEGRRNWDDYKEVLKEYLGLWSVVPVSKEEEQQLKDDFYNIFLKYGPMVDGLYNKNEYLVYHAICILNSHASLHWSSLYHTGIYTPLFVKGVGEAEFLECRDQTDIPKVVAKLMGGKL